MGNNYLLNNKGKSVEQIMFDEDIIVDLSFKYGIPVDDLKSYTSQQISDLIETGNPYYSKMIEKKINKELGNLFDEKI